MKNKPITVRTILKNLAFIAVTIILAAIAAHFLLRAGTRHGTRRTVPEFKGISLREAQQLAAENDLAIYINDSLYVSEYAGGTVLDQLPAGGVEVKPGRTIYVVINAFGERMVEMPYVAGRSLRQAKNMLDVAGLEIDKINYTHDMATNYVLEQSNDGARITSSTKREVPMGSGVVLKVGVSYDDPYTRIPNLIGLSLREAKSRIWESGLNVGRINVDEGVNLLRHKNAKVYIQGAAANSSASWGSYINITVTLDESKINSAVSVANKAEKEYEKSLNESSDKDIEEE
ncbi:MAG: PASTA domain-containing protein [Rikenellaceae bacterium]